LFSDNVVIRKEDEVAEMIMTKDAVAVCGELLASVT
jgi:hypothetical protein